MRSVFSIILCVFGIATAANATPKYEGCTKAEAATIATSIADAKALAVVAAASVGDTPVFETWFGKYSPAAGETVRRHMKSIVKAIKSGSVTGACRAYGFESCERAVYAFVYSDEPYFVNFCPRFFSLPKMSDFDPTSFGGQNGTRSGTIIHEISHFDIVAATSDECYERAVCSDMAERSSERALRNADSYQYFAEDVTYFALDPDVLE